MNTKAIVAIIFCFFICVLFNLNLHHHQEYKNLYQQKTDNIVYEGSGVRGRILDRNGIVLVDNVGVLNIVYHKNPQVTSEKELTIAQTLSPYLVDYKVTEMMKKNYFLVTHENGKSLISDEEYQELKERKITDEDLWQRKLDRIKEEDLQYSLEEEKIIYLYSVMNEGYYYQDKYLLKDISEEVALKISELKIEDLKIKTTSKRVYPYGETLKSILGSTGSIPKEELDLYLQKGYSREDIVGVSGIEKTYDEQLKGKKGKYLILDDYTLEEVEAEEPGQDLVLNLDINLQLYLNEQLKTELQLARKKKQSLYFYNAFSIIGDVTNGNILALSGMQILDDGSFQDITSTMLSSSFAMGSVVKGASSTVGYMTNAIDVGKKVLDSCVKLSFQPAKCSYKRLGYVDDITALKTSSNYFQFVTAIKSTGQNYRYNMQFNVTEENFNTYRNTFQNYGLGSLTEIDLPNEKIGMIGDKVSGDLLLNLAIGQYDTYTPLELYQYINTIANRGVRYRLNIGPRAPVVLNEVGLDNAYYDRILEGFYQVFHGGTASSYANADLQVSGKTGTSETFYDSNHDGVVDTKTINSTLALFYPRNEPKYSMIIVAPNITNSDTYAYPFTKNISLKMTNYLTTHGG